MASTNYQDLIISSKQAEGYAVEYFGIQGVAKPLPGDVDFNFYLKGKDKQEYVLKVSRPDVDIEALDFQASLLAQLANQQLPFQIPVPIPDQQGQLRTKITQQGDRWLRLQRWVPGRILAEVKPRSAGVLYSWGACCGHLSKALQGFNHPAAHRFYKWNPSETLYSKKYLTYLRSKEEIEIAAYFWALFEQKTFPILSSLRKSINHNDAHELNLVVNNDFENPSINGVIDFGDAIYTQTINELAIACAYAAMGMADPLEACCHLIRAYHAIFPLEEQEVAVLFSLIAARLMITVTNAAWSKHEEPENAYLQISEQPAWALLKKLRAISPALAHYSFRAACGWEPCPRNLYFRQWLQGVQNSFAPLLKFNDKVIVPLDLSVGSTELGNNGNFETIQKFNRCIRNILEAKEANTGIGGYGEVRPFYTTDAYQVEGNDGPKWRSVHLGLDIWAAAGTTLFAPLAGQVHSLQNNKGDCNYGPTLILEHRVSDRLTFYTLYGHLAVEDLEALQIGETITKGQAIAHIGHPPDNGNWPPHLHFQIILDLLDEEGDFPGVAFPDQQKVWKSICPDPHLLFPDLPSSTNSALIAEATLLESRRKLLGKGLSLSYQTPLHIVRGYRQYLYDTTARRYLDTVNNVAHVGHEHPRVVRAAQRQMALLNTNTRYLHEHIIRYAEELLHTFPAELCVVHFVNSGSEANELALRMAKTATSQQDIIAVAVGYHGNTGACIDISSYKFDGKGGNGAPPHTHIVPIPDTYRGPYRNPQLAGKQYAAHVQQTIEQLAAKGEKPAAFIAESILSCGGQIVLPDGYLAEAYRLVRAAGGLCIADEVQVGFGRVGHHFWGFELQGVVPDIVTLGKPMGNGHPLAAVITTRAVADAFANGMEYFNTFGGNPVSCAIGREVLRVIQEEGLQASALEVGKYLRKGLLELQQRYPIIGDVRGSGLFQGIELVEDQESLSPAARQAAYLVNRMQQRGILMSVDGPFHNVIKIKPPLCFDQQNVDFLIDSLEQVFSEDMMRL